MNYRGWMLIGLSKDYPAGKIKSRTLMNSECLVFRGESGQLNVIEPHCSHFGVNMQTGEVIKDCIRCPMHGRMFRGDGRGANPKHRPIRSYPVSENRGLAFAYFDRAGAKPEWDAPEFLNDEYPDILWRHARTLSLHHPSVPLDNSVDPMHFEFTHASFGKRVQHGEFTPDGHRALGTMTTELSPPLSRYAGATAEVITQFDSPLNTFLQTNTDRGTMTICNLLTIIEGKKCVLTQIGIGRKSLNPLDLVANAMAYAGSWYATWEDAPVWNDRKVQQPDNYAHQTDKALEAFRDWFEGFAYEPDEPAASGDLVQLQVASSA